MYACRVGPLPDSSDTDMRPEIAADHGRAHDPHALIAALTEENTRLNRRLERERRIRHQAEDIAEQGLRDLYQRQVRLETLAALAQQLSAALTPEDIGAALSHQVLPAAGAQALSLGLVGADGHGLEWVTVSGFSASALDGLAGGPLAERSVPADAVRSGRPIMIRTSAEYAENYPDTVRWSILSGAESTVGWPLTVGGNPVGILLLAWSESQPLDTAQQSFISAVATMVSQALVRARIYSDEHARAAILQSAVLPNSPVENSGLEACVTYEPADAAQGLGGDWYDIMPLPGNRTYLAVGDVVGHGLSAVEDMAQLRTAGRALAHHGLPPAQLLTELNGFTRHASHGKFATMAVAILDRTTGSLCYSTAGHPPPLFRRSAVGGVSRLADANGPVLGPLREAAYTQNRLEIRPGDILVLYTDGLVECRDMDLETGITRAERIVADWDAAADADVGRGCGLIRELLFARDRADDVCVAVLRFTR